MAALLNAIVAFAAPTSLVTVPAGAQLTVSVALCAASSARFFLANSTDDTNAFELELSNGYAQWSGAVPSGGLLSVQDFDQGSFEVFLSDNGAAFDVLDQLPLLGDTTSNQAILFSYPFLQVPVENPSYPNYSLPASLPVSAAPTSIPNFTLVIAPTAAQLTSLPQTACALLNTTSPTGSIYSNDPWLRDPQGWRSQWLVDGLSPSTNYTAYVMQDALTVSGPIYFATKSASFPCPLVYALPYCPSTTYAIPLPPLSAPAFGYDADAVPDSISAPLTQYMTNFTAMLTTFACGRDLYSPLQTCADCQTHYRTWLCAVSFPRCSEPAPDTAASGPLSALQPQASGAPSRNPAFPNASFDYTGLLPCLETCNAVDRACPYFLGIKCPTMQFNAAASYGVGFIDSGNAGEVGNGVTGAAQDQWGNVWCNGQ